MADRSAIEWTESTWNPVTGCDEVSPGCAHCYAKTFAERWRGVKGHPYENGFDLTLRPERLDQPLRWRRPRMVFVNSMSDLFHEEIPDSFIAETFGVMAAANHHTFQVLTKRPMRMRHLLDSDDFWETVNGLCLSHGAPSPITRHRPTPPNVWLGVSIENRRFVDRADLLRATPAAVRFISAEPLLGPLEGLDLTGIHWLIAGGESGPKHRPVKEGWILELRDLCAEGDVAFFFKQWGGFRPKSNGRRLDGETHDAMPPKAAQLALA